MLLLIRKLIVSASCAALFFLAFAVSAMAQTSSLEGDVIGFDGKPLAGALIVIERTDIRGNYKVKTNKKGHYFHAGLPMGTFTLRCEVDGEVVDSVSNVRTSFGDTTAIHFNLAEMQKKQEAAQAAAAQGQLTAEQTQGMSAEQKKALEEQMAERQEQLKKNKELNDAFNTGMAAKEAKQFDVAIENFEKAASVDPEQVVIWAQLAESYVQLAGAKTGAERQEALDKGSATYEKVIALKPDDPAYHNNYAIALAQGGKMKEAQDELEKAAQINPSGAGQYYYNLGAVLLNTGNQADSGIAFKKAIEADPNYANAHFQYGMFLLSQAKIGDDGSIIPPPGTMEALQKYLALAPDGPFAESAQGAMQSLQGTISTEYVNPDSRKK